MCRELLARHGEIGLNGADVLEVGAGCGVVGFLAARLGARRVIGGSGAWTAEL